MVKNNMLVGCPTSFHKEYCILEYMNGLRSLTYRKFDVALVENSKDLKYFKQLASLGFEVSRGPWIEGARERIVASRNLLRKKVLDGGYEWFLSLEQDVIPPPNLIQKLLSHNKKLISGIYFARNIWNDNNVLIPLAYKSLPSDDPVPSMRPLTHNEIFYGEPLQPIVSAGLGCLLIHREVLEQIEFRVEGDITFDDRWFFLDAFNKKIPAFVDVTQRCKHMILNRPHQWQFIKK
ncbi:MAG: hypothetical protein AABW49_04135 [Nanoarchaeota archaeon]